MIHKRALTITLFLASFLLLVTLLATNQQASKAQNNQTAFLPYIAQDITGLHFEPIVLNGLTGEVTDIAHAGDDRLFIVTRRGFIMIYKNGALVPAPFLNISDLAGGPDLVSRDGWEEGLLGLAFHPNYPQTPYFYIAYTSQDQHRVRIARYTVSANPDIANVNSEQTLLSIEKSLIDPDVRGEYSPVHNGGDLAFGPDGYLYIPVGDGGPDPFGGPSGDPDNDSQNNSNLLGTILRIDVDSNGGVPAECGSTTNYTIPADNPFVGTDGCDEIWANGLRNPWRISFDRATGDLFVADVGEWQREELTVVDAGTPGGLNFGWNCFEGTYVHRQCTGDFAFPTHEYTNSGCSIIGGYVYRGSEIPTLAGNYLFTDFCSQRVWLMKRSGSDWRVREIAEAPFQITTFGEDVNGELYVGRWDNQAIFKVTLP